MSSMNYLFTSNRLGFRNWKESDIDKMIEISGNEEVMKFFPAVATAQQTKDFIERSQIQFDNKGFCYFAVEELSSKELIGFIGFHYQEFKSTFTPAIDIGWRLHPKYWGKGYATEGATKCLEYAKKTLKLSHIISTAPKINKPSIQVMKKIGMVKKLEFIHPRIKDNARLRNCVCYEIEL